MAQESCIVTKTDPITGQFVEVDLVEISLQDNELSRIRNAARINAAAANNFKANFEMLRRNLTLDDTAEFLTQLNRQLSSLLSIIANLNQIQNKLIFYKQLTSE